MYIIFSQKLNRYYIGSCEDLDKRLLRHNSAEVTATKLGVPWSLKYSETFVTRAMAVNRELYLKSIKSRAFIESMINKNGGIG
jgi:putative endonuclease